MADVNDYEFVALKELLDVTDSKNYFEIGLIDSNVNQHLKTLPKEAKRRKDLRKFISRLSLINGDKVEENVNIRLLDGQKIRKKPKR